MRDAGNEAFEKVASGQGAFAPKIATLNSWMTDLKTGQRLVFTRVPGAGIEVSVNGAVKGTIAGDDFARALLSIWLGDSPPNPELKTGLLGGECDNVAPPASIHVDRLCGAPGGTGNNPGLVVKSPVNPSGSAIPRQGSIHTNGAPGLVQLPRYVAAG